MLALQLAPLAAAAGAGARAPHAPRLVVHRKAEQVADRWQELVWVSQHQQGCLSPADVQLGVQLSHAALCQADVQVTQGRAAVQHRAGLTLGHAQLALQPAPHALPPVVCLHPRIVHRHGHLVSGQDLWRIDVEVAFKLADKAARAN